MPGTSLVPVPFTIAGCAVLLLAITLPLDWFLDARLEAENRWLSVGNVDDARAILGAILGAVSTVLALIFSVTLLVFSMAVSQFGPRLMPYFLRNRTMQITLGLFLATFVHSLATFVVTGQRGSEVFVPQLTVLSSVALVFASFLYLVVYNNRVAQAIQTSNVLAQIVENLNAAISELLQHRLIDADAAEAKRPRESAAAVRARCLAEGGAVVAGTSGYLQRINYGRVLRWAKKHGATVSLLFMPGQFVLEGEVLAQVLPAGGWTELEGTIRGAVEIGPHRTLEQDIGFAFAQLSEVAIRALSPAVNDTYTGLSCIDWLGDAVRMLTEFPEREGAWFSADGTVRLLRPPLRISYIVRTAFDLIRDAGANSPAVTLRLLETFARLAEQLQTAEQRGAILEQVEAVWQSASHMAAADLDRSTIEAAYRLAVERLGGRE